jgi:hypothetical protein
VTASLMGRLALAPLHARALCLRALELAAMGPAERERGLAELASRGADTKLLDEVRELLPPCGPDPVLYRRWHELHEQVFRKPPSAAWSGVWRPPPDQAVLARLSPADRELVVGPMPRGELTQRELEEATAKLLEHMLDDLDAHPAARRRLEEFERSREGEGT